MGSSQHTKDCEKSTGSSGSAELLTLSSYMPSTLCTDCGISQTKITKMIGIYNHLNWRTRMRHSQ